MAQLVEHLTGDQRTVSGRFHCLVSLSKALYQLLSSGLEVIKPFYAQLNEHEFYTAHKC